MMNSRFITVWAAATALGVFTARSLPAAAVQDAGLSELDLMGCDIDIRPKGQDPSTDKQSDLYWLEGASVNTMLLKIVVPDDDLLEFGDYDGLNKVTLEEGTNIVTITIDTLSVQPVSCRVTLDSGTVVPPLTDPAIHLQSTGSYDALGPLEEPYGFDVRGPALNKERARVFITNHGITAGFTLSDFVP